MRGAWDDGGLVPEGAVMADVEGAITCAFMLPSSGHTRIEPWRKPVSFLQLQACRSSRVGNGNFGIVAVSLVLGRN